MNKTIFLPRELKKVAFVLHDIVWIFIAFWLAVGLRLPVMGEWHDEQNWFVLGGTLLLSIPVFFYLGLYRAIIRYAGNKILSVIFLGSVVSVGAMLATAFYWHIPFPRSVPIMYFLLLVVLLVGSRFAIKGLLQAQDKSIICPVIIYGAGDSGRQLLESVKQVERYYPVAFVDDNKVLWRTIIHNIPVYPPAKLSKLVQQHSVETILLAMPSAGQRQRYDILSRLEHLPCKVLSMPGIKDLVEGKLNVGTLKKVSIVDLLGREAVEPEIELMESNIKNKVIMVTGAGGSIGSELCRQIIQYSPKILILFEVSEFGLYAIERELQEFIHRHQFVIRLVPALGSVQQIRRLKELMRCYQVQTVYHAAAYKHVPLVEYNTLEGIRNNVLGTLNSAQAAISNDVETFVLISTDKAVRPTNTMGATKRMAELILQALAERKDHNTRFCMVRFGNVLASSGSVIPLFEKQIVEGGPVTVTHKDITRYFMTIPESAQLVIQAGAMGKGGDVFVLDMGEPLKIMDLAQQMIRLSGLSIRDESNPNGDIAIKVTGLRPGEKLYEELLIGEQATGTDHPRIMTTKEVMLPWSELTELLQALQIACENFSPAAARKVLLQAPTDFQPSDELCDILCTDKSGL